MFLPKLYSTALARTGPPIETRTLLRKPIDIKPTLQIHMSGSNTDRSRPSEFTEVLRYFGGFRVCRSRLTGEKSFCYDIDN
jgi:hypothetical protein